MKDKDEHLLGFTNLELDTLQKWAEEIAGQWNGDESGIQEDKAHIAEDIVDSVKNLKELLEEMGELLK